MFTEIVVVTREKNTLTQYSVLSKTTNQKNLETGFILFGTWVCIVVKIGKEDKYLKNNIKKSPQQIPCNRLTSEMRKTYEWQIELIDLKWYVQIPLYVPKKKAQILLNNSKNLQILLYYPRKNTQILFYDPRQNTQILLNDLRKKKRTDSTQSSRLRL